jgi:hypothetical protein
MIFEVPERPKLPVSRRNAARHSVKKVMFGWSDVVISSRFKEALVVTHNDLYS